MKSRGLVRIAKHGLAFVASVVAAEIALILDVAAKGAPVHDFSPIYGVFLGVLLVGGLRYLPVLILGAVAPSLLAGATDPWVLLSAPAGATVSGLLGTWWLRSARVGVNLEQVRSVLLVLGYGAVIASLLGAALECALLYFSGESLGWSAYREWILGRWLAAGIGTIIVTPFVLTWTHVGGFRLGSKQMVEVGLWFATLIVFALITFRNWAPTDVLLYPMELAIFPIMAWAAIRFGLRGASAGVLVLALLAAVELLPVLGGAHQITQSTANVWIFVGIVSVTSVCLASVMTELRQREAQVAENESRLSAFTGALPDIAFVLSKSGEILDLFASGPAMEANHGIRNAGELKGKQLADCFDSNVTRGFLETIKDALQSGTLQTYEYRLVPMTEQGRWFEARVSPMIDAAQPQVVWVAYDITQRKEAEAAIQRRDRILQASASANHGLLTISSFDEAVETALRELGKAMEVDRVLVYEVAQEEHSELLVTPRFEWDKGEAVAPVSGKLIQSGSEMEMVFPGWIEKLKDEDALLQEAHETLGAKAICALPMWLEGEFYGFLTLEHLARKHVWKESEISAARALSASICGLILICQHEEELRVAERQAHAASIAKGEFLAMMSHEIRIPMNAIIGYTDILRQSDLNATQEEQTAIIKRSGRALMELINSILDYSKIESQALELESRRFDLEQVVCEALEAILPAAKEKGLRVDYNLAPEVNEHYVGDSHRLKQILLNLANNAVKFTETGSVVLSVALKEQIAVSGADVLHFEVQDTGCGIDPDKFDRIFNAFSQVDSSTTRKHGGTGLGLAISQRLVERMGGKIWVESEPGQGTRFQFTVALPRPEQLSRTRSPFQAKKMFTERLEATFSQKAPLRLLLCEDDADNRLVLLGMLESLGYHAVVTSNPEEAIAEIQHGSFDVALLDIQLPGMNGLELTRQIREGSVDPGQKALYIIAVTAYAMNEDRESCFEAGMDDYISKPVDVSLLKSALSTAFETIHK